MADSPNKEVLLSLYKEPQKKRYFKNLFSKIRYCL